MTSAPTATPIPEPKPAAPRPPKRRRAVRWIMAVLWVVAILVIAGVVGGWLFLRGSLPQRDGNVLAAGLRAPVTIERDAHGVPTLRGSDRSDIAYATGYVHAQGRFFQMDLLRRAASGELAGLLGPTLLPVDRERRIHRFAARALAALAAMPEADRLIAERYAAGVNAGLASLDARPFEYAALRSTPRPWAAQDAMLVDWAMYFDLQDNQLARVFTRGWLRDQGATPAQLAALLATSTPYDAPLDAPAIADDPPPPFPTEAPAWLGRPAKATVAFSTYEAHGDAAVGSSNWALAGSRSADGAAIVANDMHLTLRLPHIWYRLAVEIQGAAGTPTKRIVGVSIPGTPIVTAGSNGQVAWGFTNSYGNYLDLLELELDPKDPSRYRMAPGFAGAPADGWGLMRTVQERIAIAGQADELLPVRETAYGPVWERGGKLYAVHWVAHDPGAANLALMGMEQAATVGDALAVGAAAGIPAQNLVAGDAAGHIGWTIAGPIPGRSSSFASTFPAPAASAASHTWGSIAAPASHPRVIDPAGGQIATGNARQLADAAGYAAIGDGGADLGARQRQVRDDVAALGPRTDELAVYGVGADDRALYLAPWRDRALQALAGDPQAEAAGSKRAEYRRLLETTWTGRASIDSVGYRLTQAFVAALYGRLFAGLDENLRAVEKSASFARASSRWPALVARLLDEKPAGWLPAGHADWRALQLAAIDDAIAAIEKTGTPLAEATWGKRNTTHIVHPMAKALPLGLRWLAAPAEPMAGDSHMPKVAAPEFGQSERFAISPGREASAVFSMPGGQSGHPLSENFLSGHADWVAGRATPLLPGPAVHSLRLEPR